MPAAFLIENSSSSGPESLISEKQEFESVPFSFSTLPSGKGRFFIQPKNFPFHRPTVNTSLHFQGFHT